MVRYKIKYSDIVNITLRAVSRTYYRAIIEATPGVGIVADAWEIDIIDNVVTVYNEEWGDVVRFLEDGVKKHTIEAKPGKMLRWKVGPGDKFAFAKKVKHPGIKARKFVKRVLVDGNLEREFNQIMEEEIQKLISKL